MSNPAIRTNSLLAQLMAKKSNLAIVSETETGLTPVMEKKANELAARILDESSTFVDADSPNAVDEPSDSTADDYLNQGTTRFIPESVAKKQPETPVRSFELPDVNNCGLWNPDITLDESQVAAVRSLAAQQYGCLIGAAGTGKTTVQKYLLKELIYGEDSSLEVYEMQDGTGLNIACVAFTGMAVQVMKTNLPTWMHRACKTIHSLLEFEPEEMVSEKTGRDTRIFMPQRNSVRKLNIDMLIIDEASMVGLDLWMQLLAALKPGVRIYMTGDLNQLPPIIGQPIFAYALSTWHVSELTKVHRQKEAGANRIVEVAHEVLNGKTDLTFDVLKGNPDWRVIYQQLDDNPVRASKEIINILNQLRQRPIDPNDPDSPMLYNPHLDRVMTAGNGFDPNTTSSEVQQAPLNERLSYLIEPPTKDHPRIKIDAGRVERKFSVNNRVMATKNEPPNKEGRITNGQAGTIVDIFRNEKYRGNPMMFGDESEVEDYQRMIILQAASGVSKETRTIEQLSSTDFDLEYDDGVEYGADSLEDGKLDENDKSNVASHSVTVMYDNGSQRTYTSMSGVESIQLAYCSTVAKCQGSQFDTAIIVCHHAEKNQLSREWLYTAITRGAKRVIILGTPFAVRYAISRQKIKGRTLEEKIQRYQDLLKGEAKTAYGGKMRISVPLFVEDYVSNAVRYESVGNFTGGESANAH